jgi:hypothetical protein
MPLEDRQTHKKFSKSNFPAPHFFQVPRWLTQSFPVSFASGNMQGAAQPSLLRLLQQGNYESWVEELKQAGPRAAHTGQYGTEAHFFPVYISSPKSFSTSKYLPKQ